MGDIKPIGASTQECLEFLLTASQEQLQNFSDNLLIVGYAEPDYNLRDRDGLNQEAFFRVYDFLGDVSLEAQERLDTAIVNVLKKTYEEFRQGKHVHIGELIMLVGNMGIQEAGETLLEMAESGYYKGREDASAKYLHNHLLQSLGNMDVSPNRLMSVAFDAINDEKNPELFFIGYRILRNMNPADYDKYFGKFIDKLAECKPEIIAESVLLHFTSDNPVRAYCLLKDWMENEKDETKVTPIQNMLDELKKLYTGPGSIWAVDSNIKMEELLERVYQKLKK